MRKMCEECPWRGISVSNKSLEELKKEHDIHACHMINKKKYNLSLTNFMGDKQLTYCVGSVNYAKERNTLLASKREELL